MTTARLLLLLPCCILALTALRAQQPSAAIDEDARYIRLIHDQALTRGTCHEWLRHLTKGIGARLSGSPQAAAAVEYTRQMLDTLGLDSVWLQPCLVPHWVRGEREMVRIARSAMGSQELKALALGGSVGTGPDGLSAQVVEVKGIAELEQLGRERLEGKIVFFSRPFDPTQINTFSAYGGAVDQRGAGASAAARYGSVGVLVRSMASGQDDIPHTGGLAYREDLPKIPAFGISTNDAELLSRLLRQGPVEVYMRSTCRSYPDKLSYNVIGEIRGSEKPAEIILVGGHLDSWDLGEGAHDDGAGCVQSMEVLRLFRQLGYQPKRTIRCVLFMNEENGLRGGTTYAKEAKQKEEVHLAALESDRGGFTPRGFTVEGSPEVFTAGFAAMKPWLDLLEPYYLHVKKGGSGADISPLRDQGVLLIGYEPDSQRYFDFHHTAADVFEAVNKRELELGAAAMTSLVYLLDKYGIGKD